MPPKPKKRDPDLRGRCDRRKRKKKRTGESDPAPAAAAVDSAVGQCATAAPGPSGVRIVVIGSPLVDPDELKVRIPIRREHKGECVDTKDERAGVAPPHSLSGDIDPSFQFTPEVTPLSLLLLLSVLRLSFCV